METYQVKINRLENELTKCKGSLEVEETLKNELGKIITLPTYPYPSQAAAAAAAAEADPESFKKFEKMLMATTSLVDLRTNYPNIYGKLTPEEKKRWREADVKSFEKFKKMLMATISLVDLRTNYPNIYGKLTPEEKNRWHQAHYLRSANETWTAAPTRSLTGGKRRRKPSVKALKTKRKQLKEKIKKAEKCVKTCTKNKLKLKKQCK